MEKDTVIRCHDCEHFGNKELCNVPYCINSPRGREETEQLLRDAERWRFMREHLMVWPEEMADHETRPCLVVKYGHGVIPSGLLPHDSAVWPEEVDLAVDTLRAARALSEGRGQGLRPRQSLSP
jgi:hypothetical protein